MNNIVCILYNVYITYKNERIEVENNVVSLFTFWMRSSLVQSKNFICNKTDNFEVCIKEIRFLFKFKHKRSTDNMNHLFVIFFCLHVFWDIFFLYKFGIKKLRIIAYVLLYFRQSIQSETSFQFQEINLKNLSS